jgi:hypothetical protein
MPAIPLPSNASVIKRVAGADPAANNEALITVPVAANEVQTITGTPSATFGLSIGGDAGPTTLTTTATAASIQTYLRALPSLGSDGATVTGGPIPSTCTVTFAGANTTNKPMPLLAVTGGVTGLTFARTTAGTGPKWWWVQSVCIALVQGATQTPQPILIIDDGTVSVFQGFGSSAAQAVSTTCTYTWAPGLVLTGQIGATTTVNSQGALSDDLVLPPGYRIRTLTLGLGANSDYGVPSALVVELG